LPKLLIPSFAPQKKPIKPVLLFTSLYQQWGLTSAQQQSEWRSRYRLTQDQIDAIATRNLRLEKFIETTWGHRLESYFLQHKHNLDQVIYSLIRHRDRDLLNEL
jgi:hypothetical protein